MSMEIGIKTWQTNNPYLPENTKKKEDNTKNQEQTKKASDGKETGVVYEKSSDAATYSGTVTKKPTYEISKKSPSERAAIVEQMKKAADEQKQSLIEMVQKMMNTQSGKQKLADGMEPLGGTVTEEARRKAAEDISENGYWGVKQTSQRLFDFASALAGDDVEKMKKMQEAMNKGISQASAKLGGLPSICQETQEAANDLFKEYYKSKGVEA